MQDNIGFLWFASQNGLIRYDGQNYVSYHHDPQNENTIASDYVEWVFVDSKGLLWIGHWGDGITCFDPISENCIRYRSDPNDPETLSGNEISMILEDRSGFIWAATSNGLSRIDPKNGKCKRFIHNPANPKTLSDNFVRSLYIDKSNTLWVGCGFAFDEQNQQGRSGGLNRYEGNDYFTRYLHDPKNPMSLADNRVRAIFEDSKGHFWVGSSGGLQRMNRQTGHFEHASSPVLNKNVAAFPAFYHISFIHEDQCNRLWVGAVEGGLHVFDPDMHLIGHFEEAMGMTDSLQNNHIWQFCQTRDGTIWIATASLGGAVYRLKSTENLFPYFKSSDVGLKSAIFPGVLKDADGGIWLQSHGDFEGILHFDRKTGITRRFYYDPPMTERTFLDFEELRLDPHGNIWASTPRGLYVLNRLEYENGSKHFRMDTFFNRKISARPLWPPYFDKRGNVWIASFGGGLFRFDAQRHLSHFSHNTSDSGSIGGNQVEVGIFEDSRKNLWVPGGSIGNDTLNPMFLDRFNFDNNSFEHFIPPGEIGDPGNIAEDDKGNFWMIGYPYGIRKVNPQAHTFEHFPADKSALINNAISAEVKAEDGKLWFVATGVIIELDPETEQLYQYTNWHGVQDFSWSWTGQGTCGKDGEILFCGNNGFHAFYPDKIRQIPAKIPPKISLTTFDAIGIKHTINPVLQTGAILLNHNQNTFFIGVANFDFSGSDVIHFEFMLENYDRDWRSDLLDGRAYYYNVSPGKYIFRARCRNSLGVWSKQDAVMNITIRPPWWKSFWAIFFYIALIGIVLYIFYLNLLNRRLDHAEAQRLRELDSVKTRLYANITHEFRTPLTVILGNLDLIKPDAEKLPIARFLNSKTEIIRRNTLRLLNLVNQMLDLAKLDSGKIMLKMTRGEVVGFLKYIVESFHSMAASKKIRLHFLAQPERLEMNFDAEKLQQVLSNLLSNALKFTPEGGDVYVLLANTGTFFNHFSEANRFPGSIQIIVKDTGIGIASEKLPHIFDRFFQADDSYTKAGEGTGIGLALVKELVKLMGGEISVKSIQEHGSEFVVTLPVMINNVEADQQKPESGTPAFYPELWESEVITPALRGQIMLEKGENDEPLLLIVEDNADVVDYLIACLSGYQLAIARDGMEGLERAFETVPDLVVCDVMMPRMDGLELCQKLKSDLRTSHIPVVMLTAKADFHSKMEGLESGADVYLAKPFHKEELQIRIRKLLEVRQKLQHHYLTEAGLAKDSDNEKRPWDIPQPSGMDDAFVKKARLIVDAHLDDFEFDVEKLCRELCLSHSQVHRKLYALTGLSATLFIRYIRLNKSKELLSQKPEWSITAIAFDSGFNDPGYFARVFRQEFGMTPQEWRKSRPENEKR